MFWNTTGRAPARALQSQIDHLSAFSPPPAFSPSNLPTHHSSASKGSLAPATRPSLPVTHSPTDDLDSPDEIALRDLLLGTLYRSLGSRVLARAFLEAVVHAAGSIAEEKWIVPFASLELAVLECQEADAEEATLAPGDKAAAQVLWKARSKKADRWIESVYTLPEYDLKSRCVLLSGSGYRVPGADEWVRARQVGESCRDAPRSDWGAKAEARLLITDTISCL